MVWWSSPQKGSCIWDLTAQASGQALIRGSESAGSATLCFSFHTPLRHSLILHFSSPRCLSAACRFVSSFSPPPQDLLCPSYHQREMSPLTLCTAKKGCFHQVGFLLGCFCILIKILCVFAWVCGLTTYYRNSRGALAITSARLCVLQM